MVEILEEHSGTTIVECIYQYKTKYGFWYNPADNEYYEVSDNGIYTPTVDEIPDLVGYDVNDDYPVHEQLAYDVIVHRFFFDAGDIDLD